MSGVLRVLLIVSAVVALLFSLVSMWVRFHPLINLAGLVVAVGSPYGTFAAMTAFIVLAICRQKMLSILAIAVVAVMLAVQVRWYYIGTPLDVGAHTDVRVLSSNLRKGQADVGVFVPLAKESADVITVSELTPELAQRFSQAGIDDQFPYSVLVPAPGAQGIGLWSRFPISKVMPPAHTDVTVVAARLRIPGVRFDPLVASVHITSPVASERNAFSYWRTGIVNTKGLLADFTETVGPAAVIVGGDFNSTPDMQQFRALTTNGYSDAVRQTGAGFAPTFPANSQWIPPLITIDHVLTRNSAASSITTVEVPGSDHRSLLATVQVPLDSTAS